MKLACAILKCVNLIILLYGNLHEMSLLPNISAHLLKLNINIGSKYYTFVSFIKHVPFQLIRYLFIQIYEKKKYSVHVCPNILLLLHEVGPENLENLLLFPLKQPFTILSTICVPLNCEPKIIRMRPTLGLLLITQSGRCFEILCLNQNKTD